MLTKKLSKRNNLKTIIKKRTGFFVYASSSTPPTQGTSPLCIKKNSSDITSSHWVNSIWRTLSLTPRALSYVCTRDPLSRFSHADLLLG